MEDLRSRGWLITIPRIYKEKKIPIKKIYHWYSTYGYLIFQLEKGSDTDYLHYQIYLECSYAIRFSVLKNICSFAHLEKRNGTKEDCFVYCTKEDTRVKGPFEFGTKPIFDFKKEKKGVYDRFVDQVLNGANDYELLIEFPSIIAKDLTLPQKIRMIEKNKLANEVRKNLEVSYISGLSGTGKSSLVRRLHDSEDLYVVSNYKHPFDDYAGEAVIVLEEYRDNFSLSFLLQLLDIYPLKLPCRYFNKSALFTKVYIISNWPLEEQYKYDDIASVNALDRRIHTKVFVYTDYIHYFDNNIKQNKRIEVNPISCNFEQLSMDFSKH